ncbi:MAG: YdcF family protein [Defluviitaleaceae bacterium]|nr:YdcF family protein [Defluviitaleaceae bacterium]
MMFNDANNLMKVFRAILIIIGALAAANFFVSLLFSWHFGSILLAIVAADLIFCGIFLEKMPIWGRRMVLAFYSVLIIFAIFLAGYGNTRTPDADAAAVIVLGAGLRDGEPGGHLARRLDAAAEFLHDNPHVPVVVTGGLGAGQTVTEAQAMATYLMRAGIAEERIFLEDTSTSTFENLLNSRKIFTREMTIHPNYHHYVIVSNDFHIYRATRTANRLGLNVSGLPAPTPWHSLAPNYLREMAATIAFWLQG